MRQIKPDQLAFSAHCNIVMLTDLHRVSGEAVALRVDRRTSDQKVVGLTLTPKVPHNNLRQVVHTLVPLSPSSIIWYRLKGSDPLRLRKVL